MASQAHLALISINLTSQVGQASSSAGDPRNGGRKVPRADGFAFDRDLTTPLGRTSHGIPEKVATRGFGSRITPIRLAPQGDPPPACTESPAGGGIPIDLDR